MAVEKAGTRRIENGTHVIENGTKDVSAVKEMLVRVRDMRNLDLDLGDVMGSLDQDLLEVGAMGGITGRRAMRAITGMKVRDKENTKIDMTRIIFLLYIYSPIPGLYMILLERHLKILSYILHGFC